jgi:uncharacterized protein (TIGR02001 family)
MRNFGNVCIFLLSMAAVALGATAAAAEEAISPHTFTSNVALVSDYRFRGISQSYDDPAIQGGIDYTHASGAYLGTWASNVSGNQYLGGNGMEWDIYGGYRYALGPVTLDAGLLYYLYPSARTPTINPPGPHEKYDTLEAYVGAAWRFLTLKYSYALTDLFGVQQSTYGGACNRVGTDCFGTAKGDSDGSGYLDLSGSYPIATKFSVVGHIGHQRVSNYSKLDYTDWKVGLTYDLNGFLLGAAWVDTDADDDWYYAGNGRDTELLGDSTIVLSVSRTF